MLTLETTKFRSAHKNIPGSQFWPPHKNKSISVLTLNPCQFLSPTQNQANFDPSTDVKSISIPTPKSSNFCMPPYTKTKFISIQTVNQVIFDPHTKTSQLRSLHWNQVKSDPPRWSHVYFDHPHNNQVNLDANTRTISFSGRYFACYTYIPVHVLVIHQRL